MTKTSLAFIACIENNRIASETLLLFASIRKFAGRYSQSTTYSFNPRGLGSLQPSHYDQLRSLAVQHSDEVLNLDYRDYPLANKIYAAARAEEIAKEDVLVLIDSDSVFLNEPDAFDLHKDIIAATTPVWAVGIGSRGPDDPTHTLWDAIRQTCGIAHEPPYIRTRLTQEPVSFYCNSGLIVVRRSAGIFARWRECFVRLYNSPRIRGMLACGPPDDSGFGPEFFLEQASLAVALMPFTQNIALLDYKYNCPLHNRPLLQRSYPDEIFDLDSIIHFHYNRMFHKPDFLESFSPTLNSKSMQYNWLARRLPLQPVLTTADGPDFVTAFNRRMQDWRESLARFCQPK